MSYPSSKPRRLQRSRNDRWIGGVCGGLAEFLNMDATLVRVLVVVLAVVTAAFPVALVYLAMMLLVPEAPPGPPSSIGPRNRQPGAGQFGTSQYGWNATNSRPTEDPVWGAGGPPWQKAAGGNPP
ncbi:MAG TPA: PspC domain-containing protein, partial [Microlunatus sp.]